LGWQQAVETEPHLFNHDLQLALANLNPGEVHEIHAPSENQPGILVHTAIVHDEEKRGDGESDEGKKARMGIVHTRCPERT